MAGRIVIGTSSWADPGFVEEWYPPDLPARDRLRWYAERFEAVEVNSTFYAVPSPRTVARWAQETADDFTFDGKLHRLLSRHSADLKSLPPALRDDATTNARGRVQLTPDLEAATRRDVAYLRAHGRNLQGYLRGRSVAERFAHRYADDELEELGERAGRLAEEVPTVRMMFNNNRGADAPHAAQRMRELLGQEV